jgi:5-methylcytosine-specific restriction endonuclease McrA
MERFDVDKEPVYHLFELFKAGRINLSPTYQRGKVWSDDLRYTLIESIRSEFPIGLIMFNVSHHVDDEGIKMEVYDAVDGQQRLRTIFEFIDGEEDWAKQEKDDFSPFKELASTQQTRFREYKIPVAKMKDFELEEITECYNRLQKGRPLKIGEKLKSLVTGGAHRYIDELSHHKIFTIHPRHKVRDGHWTLAAAFFKSIYTRELLARQEYPQLERFMREKLKPTKAKKALEECKKILNYEHRVIEEALRKNSDFGRYAQTARTLKWLFVVLATLRRTYAISGREHKVAEGLLNYYESIARENSEEWVNYVNTGRTGRIDTPEVRNCLVQLADQIVITAKLEPLDPKRLFTAEQRAQIYENAQGRCQARGCGIDLSPTNFHADHQKLHSRGGKTTVHNGRALCTRCNREKGNTWKEIFPVTEQLERNGLLR